MEELIEQNMGLVLSVVKCFNPKNQTEQDDYVQAGRLGLWKAISKYSATGGSKFSPYAWNPIKWEIIKEIRSTQSKHTCISIDDNPHLCASNTRTPFWELLPLTLTKDEANVINLRLEGYNFKEISNKLTYHRSKIKKLFNNALSKIREANDG